MNRIAIVAMFLIGILVASLNPVCNGQVEEGTVVFDMQALVTLIRDARAAKEIEVSDEQVAEFAEIQSRAGSIFGEAQSRLNLQLEADQDIARHNRALAEARTVYLGSLIKGLNDVLVPFQVKRLEQLMLWSAINKGGFAALFNTKLVRDQLELDASNVREISKRAAELQKEFDEELRKLQLEYRDKLLESLDEDERSRLKEMLGEESLLYHVAPKF